jgi:hypothetical protein
MSWFSKFLSKMLQGDKNKEYKIVIFVAKVHSNLKQILKTIINLLQKCIKFKKIIKLDTLEFF